MPRTKKEKIPELYQILDEGGNPVRIKTGYISAIERSRVGKIYQSKAAALFTIRKAIKQKNKEPSTRFDYATALQINKKNVSNDEWQEALLKLKIRIFRPADTEEVTFHLDKIK
jgi:hypothetical protein